jgi:4,5-DOPA dioxygenase extradiol
MTMPILPTVFVSHGAPTLALEPGNTGEFLRWLGRELPRPNAVLCVSAHWTTVDPMVSASTRPETIHDFSGFPDQLYRITYPAPGAAALAERVEGLLEKSGFSVNVDPARGLDHGAWVPLRLMYPEADIPTTQLSVQPGRDATWHYRLGAALQPLGAEGILVLASGGAVHNLRAISWEGGALPPWAQAFDEWLAKSLAEGHPEDLLDWQHAAPFARQAQPTDEHLLPLFVAWGAAGTGARGERIHQGFTLSSLSMAAFRFEKR